MKNLIRLKWWKDPNGYKLSDDKKYICPLSMPPKLNSETGQYSNVRWHHVDGSKDNISMELINRAKHPEGALSFTEEYGLLDAFPNDIDNLSPTVASILSFADRMRIISSVRTHRFRVSDQDRTLEQAGDCHVSLVIPAKSNKPRLFFEPVKLVDLILLEVNLILAGGGFIRACKNCEKFFPVGPGTDTYKSRKTCNDRCRKAVNRLEQQALPD